MMKNPFEPQQDPNLYSYVNLQKRVLKNMQAARVTDQIFSAMQKAFEDALKQETVVLSSTEKQRMLAQVMKQVLTDMLSKLDDTPKN
jgi:hypothetical protein